MTEHIKFTTLPPEVYVFENNGAFAFEPPKRMSSIICSKHRHFDRDWLSIIVDGVEINPPPKEESQPETWRDREPLL